MWSCRNVCTRKAGDAALINLSGNTPVSTGGRFRFFTRKQEPFENLYSHLVSVWNPIDPQDKHTGFLRAIVVAIQSQLLLLVFDLIFRAIFDHGDFVAAIVVTHFGHKLANQQLPHGRWCIRGGRRRVDLGLLRD